MTIKRIIRHLFQSSLLFTISINVILAFLALISGGFAARLLGVTERGELAAIQLWPTFLAGISMLGLSDAVVYFTARKYEQAGSYLVSTVGITLLVSLPFMCLGYLLLPIFLESQTPEVITASRVYLLMIPTYSLVSLPLQALRGRNDLFIWNLLRLVRTSRVGFVYC